MIPARKRDECADLEKSQTLSVRGDILPLSILCVFLAETRDLSRAYTGPVTSDTLTMLDKVVLVDKENIVLPSPGIPCIESLRRVSLVSPLVLFHSIIESLALAV